MKKENFVALMMGTVSGLIFALGMCMCLLPDWGMFNTGVGFGIVGFVGLLITWIAYRKMTGKKPVKVNIKVVGKVLYAIFASLVLGVGMCMVMVFENMMIQGILVGIAGIILLLLLIPMCIGLKKSEEE